MQTTRATTSGQARVDAGLICIFVAIAMGWFLSGEQMQAAFWLVLATGNAISVARQRGQHPRLWLVLQCMSFAALVVLGVAALRTHPWFGTS